MGVLRFLRTKLGIDLGSAGESVRDFLMTEEQKAVAALKQTSLGNTVAKLIDDVSTKRLTGEQKFAAVLSDATPLVVAFLTNKGAVGLAVSEVEDMARELVQSVFNDTKSTTAGSLATQVLALLGVKI